MKNVVTPQEIIEQYAKICAVLKETNLTGDYKKGNREFRKGIKIFKILENDIDLAKQTLPLMFEHENEVVRTKVAAHCLSLKIHIDQAEKILQDISRDASHEIFEFAAQMTLDVWRKQGYLKTYKEQQMRK